MCYIAYTGSALSTVRTYKHGYVFSSSDCLHLYRACRVRSAVRRGTGRRLHLQHGDDRAFLAITTVRRGLGLQRRAAFTSALMPRFLWYLCVQSGDGCSQCSVCGQ
jgi:hypothetical protein